MKKSFIERIFPHSEGSTLPRYEDDYAVPSPSPSPLSPPRILLQDSTVSPSPAGSASTSPPRLPKSLSASLVRYNDPFLPVERAAKSLERNFQAFLDAQSEGLSAGVGSGPSDDTSSVGSPTPTPSATSPTRGGLKTVPIRQPKAKKTTLRGARRGLAKSMVEYAALKEWELSLIEREVAARDNALKQASDLGNRRRLLEDEIQKVKTEEEGDVILRSEVENVEREIQQLETALLELRSRHRQLVGQLRQKESSRDSEVSSYRESLTLNDSQVKTFLRRPPVPQSLSNTPDSGMYALKPERRTLQMAEEQWTSEMETLNLRKSDVTNEKHALEEGSRLWRELVKRITDFEKGLQAQTRELSRSELIQTNDDHDLAGQQRKQHHSSPDTPEDVSLHAVLSKLSTLIDSLQGDLEHAESKNWKLLICAIGAELSAFEQARDLLRETAGIETPDDDPLFGQSDSGNGRLVDHDDDDYDDQEHHDAPHEDLLMSGGLRGDLPLTNGGLSRLDSGPRSPGESSNQSLEDTLREFGNGLVVDEGDGMRHGQDNPNPNPSITSEPTPIGNDDGPGFAARPEIPTSGPSATYGRESTRDAGPTAAYEASEDEDDPGPAFLLSHS